MKVYVIIESFEKDSLRGYVNTVWKSKAEAERNAKMLRENKPSENYTCKVVAHSVL